MVDYFRKWWEAVPIPQQDALTVVRTFIDHWVPRYGAPVSLHSDQGTAFESHLVAQVYQLLRIPKTHHPEGNGSVERTNRTIKTFLQSFINNSTECWDDAIPQCFLAYRSSVRGFFTCYLTFQAWIMLTCEDTNTVATMWGPRPCAIYP